MKILIVTDAWSPQVNGVVTTLVELIRGLEARGYATFRRFHASSSGVMVSTQMTVEILQTHRFERLLRWSHGADLTLFKPVEPLPLDLPRPVSLHVARISYAKNVEAFLKLDLPGSKLVDGAGPLLPKLRENYLDVHWRGVVPREAMACGTPVAAFSVAGPRDMVADSTGGVLDHDLGHAALRALAVPRKRARARALAFDGEQACDEFVGFLVEAEPTAGRCAPTRPSAVAH